LFYIVNDKERQSILSRTMIRKIFGLLNSQYIVHEGRLKAVESARSLGEWTCINLIHSHQNSQQVDRLIHNLRLAVASRVGEFPVPGTIFLQIIFFI
jgi:hypothetical protein